MTALETTPQSLDKLLKKNRVEASEVFLLSLDRLGNYTLVKKGKNQ